MGDVNTAPTNREAPDMATLYVLISPDGRMIQLTRRQLNKLADTYPDHARIDDTIYVFATGHVAEALATA